MENPFQFMLMYSLSVMIVSAILFIIMKKMIFIYAFIAATAVMMAWVILVLVLITLG